MDFQLHHGDCRTVMATLDAESVDAIVTDPPYGLSFMGKGWDHGVPGVEFWSEAMRVAKPGAHLLAFGGTRTYHRLACAIEDAGWEIRDCVMWVYGSGFPKSHDVSKAIDKAAGAAREVVGSRMADDIRGGNMHAANRGERHVIDITAPATPAARQWSGWGTALKPAWEPIIVARKPLVGTVAENVLRHGTGAINIDGTRVGNEILPAQIRGVARPEWRTAVAGAVTPERAGRWPANLIHDGSEEVVGLFPVTGASTDKPRRNTAAAHNQTASMGKAAADWVTHGHSDAGGSAARFFYCAKASKADRDEGCEGLNEKHVGDEGRHTMSGPMPVNYTAKDGIGRTLPRRNHHPTVKPTALMRYLCRLVTPPGGIVLDPFCGSGSTGKASVLEGFRFIGIEREAEYVEIARARIAAATGERPAPPEKRPEPPPLDDLPLFRNLGPAA